MKQDFALLVVDTSGRWDKLTRYMLARLESDASGRSCDPDTDPGTVEHILPRIRRIPGKSPFPMGCGKSRSTVLAT